MNILRSNNHRFINFIKFYNNNNINNNITNNIKLFSSKSSLNSNNFNNNSYNRNISYKSFQSIKTDYKFSNEDEVFQEIKDYKNYEEKGNYSAAKSILNRSLQMVESTLGRKHDITINVLFRMVNLELIIGDLSSAEKYCNQILNRIQDQLYTSPISIPTLNYLMICHQYQGDKEKCFKVIDQIIDIAKKNNDYEVVVSTLLNKAIVLSLDCDDEADSVYNECIKLSKENLDESNKLNESILSNYACYLHSKGDNDILAEELYLKSKELAEKNNNDIELVNILANYGEFLYDSDQFDKAVPVLENAIQKSEMVYGRNNSKVGCVLYVLGKLYRDKGSHSWAEGFFNKCITIFEDHKNNIKRRENERELINKNESSNYHYQPGKRERELRNNKEVDIEFGNVLWDYAQMMREKGRLKEAENLEERARKLNSFEE
ncbi:hypothetical protein DICPUDRAFT_80480 [Dictyostelium purpureum]|uniref:MalT-like TPR region domain-containing protein n=1 Tax=Dictyostelium purpureum TaxID=5786 RepID=F0ZQL4_DICPU|nr:uncharacterized protein DICPUDRAFT_80480 [Dictyostelium purpureum]EGC33773.1 hypothetical protein DICPUDRAFT_80480 [Dictyostelium purpureum]|eukprot:XP_003289698.1 hypothetical protein DICPUDRAFT_80480 [Dictyostelium purpureum]